MEPANMLQADRRPSTNLETKGVGPYCGASGSWAALAHLKCVGQSGFRDD